ncbi:MAG: PocR ligand-binding domain-containing protein [Clostridia bacterium]|nr:PocR ligand-binding domain-containing protein [Clostridia bacterium]
MSLLLRDKELRELLQNFYVLTGMTVSLFDENHKGVVAYPDISRTFCNLMKQVPEFRAKCWECDRTSFATCRKTKALTTYRCHAGLIEATTPVIKNGKIIGYLMFGQITDQKHKEPFRTDLAKLCKSYGVDEDLSDVIRQIKHRNETQIQAAAKILDACSEYIQLKEMVHHSEKRMITLIEEFIDEHIDEEITIERLCKEFNVSRTHLYNQTRPYISGGIGAFVRQKRMEKAKELLVTTDIPIPEIATMVGFFDYNYFLKVFRQTYHTSPKKIVQDKTS